MSTELFRIDMFGCLCYQQAYVPNVETAPFAETEGALRLMGRVDVNGFATGALQMFLGCAWGAVCTASFGHTDTLVACRQLGFATGGRIPLDPSFRSRNPDLVCITLAANFSCG